MKSRLVRRLAVLLVAVAAMLAVASPAWAETFTVTNTDDSGPGSLRQAIADANAGPGADEISFSDALAGRTVELSSVGNPGAFPGPSALVVTSPISIQGPANTEGVTIARAGGDGTPEMRLFYVAPGGDLILKNLTLSGGLARGGDGGDGGFDYVNDDYQGGAGGGGGAAGMGGAIFNEGNLTIEGSTFTGNTARGGDGGTYILEERGGGGGGGLATDGGDGNVPNGAAGPGGGGGGGDGGEPNGGGGAGYGALFGGQLPGDTGGEGGGGGGGGSRLNLAAIGLSRVHVGGAGGFGGGAGGGAGALGIVDDSFSVGGFGGGGGIGSGGFGGGAGNVFQGGGGSGMGGAIFNRGGDVVLANSTLSGNTAVGGISPPGTFAKYNGAGLGGGLFSVDGAVSATNATVADNAGGGIHAYQRPQGERSGPSTFDLTNTILANNPGAADCANGAGGAATGLSNLIENNDGCADVVSASEPNLGPLADNGGPTRTHALLPGSPAINSAHTQGAPATDQRGVPRPQPRGGAADIGAYEYAPDTAPPTVTASVSPAPNQNGWNNSDATVTINATDDRGGSGVERVSYSASGAQAVAEQNVSGASANLVVSTEGETVVTYSATDKDGNASPQKQVTVKLDKSAPDTTVDSGPSGQTNEQNPAFGFSSSEPDVSFECALDGRAYAPCSSPNGYPGLSEGQHDFSVRARDRAGNTDPTPATRSFTVDISAPEATITVGPQGTSKSAAASFSFTSEPRATFECSLDGSAFEACSSPKDYAALSDGKHTFEVRAKDAMGNVEPTPARRTWSVDTASPDTAITSGPSGIVRSASASFHFSSPEAGSKFECKLDGGAFSPCASPKGYSGLANGEHTFSVRAMDAADNADPTPEVRTWTVDAARPTISGVSTKIESTNGNRRLTIRATVRDNLTALQKANVKLYVNGKRITRFSYSASTGKLVYNSPNVARGKKTVKIVATDAAGNAATKSWSFTIR